MNRRDTLLALMALGTAPLAAEAQKQAAKIPRIGVVVSGRRSAFAHRVKTFRQGMRDLGYVEGRNIVIDDRYAEGQFDQVRGFLAEFVRVEVDVIVTHGSPPVLAAKRATTTIPIVMANVGDAVATGIVTSLARPGGNVTGLSTEFPEITAKGLEFLRATLPRIKLVAVLSNPTNLGHAPMLKATMAAARGLGLETLELEARVPDDLNGAFSLMTKKRADALVVLDEQLFVSQKERIAKLAVDSGLPTVFAQSENVEAGGFMSYGVRLSDMWYRSAYFVDKILKGAKPADLPVEQPTTFEMVINRKTAKALGLTIPQSVLVRTDRVIE